jgi:hypothetical protein
LAAPEKMDRLEHAGFSGTVAAGDDRGVRMQIKFRALQAPEIANLNGTEMKKGWRLGA